MSPTRQPSAMRRSAPAILPLRPARALAGVAALVGEPTRAAMLVALLDGRERSAGELADAAELSAPATSLHLAKLCQGGLLLVTQRGRHRCYRLAGSEVVRALEALGAVATAASAAGAPSRAAARSLPGMPRGTSEHRAFCAARTCFDHLAGVLAIELAALLEARRVLVAVDEQRYELGPKAATWLGAELRVEVGALPRGRRPLARRCLDWTERRPHLAGALGAAILERFFQARWLVKTDTRALRISAGGKAQLLRLGMPPPLVQSLTAPR
jgi:DNA-binding transcriptional ArsR family regulator